MDILEHALAQRIGGVDGEIVEALCDEVARLRAALEKANANAERFEREWYLRGDAIERAIDAWDCTVLPVSDDGMMQERMECLRAALVPNALNSGDERAKLSKFPLE